MSLSSLDLTTFAIYCVLLIGIAWWVSRDKPGHQKDSEDYFLAGKSLPWWAIGASLIAANISAEQIIGMSGSGFAIGLVIALTDIIQVVLLVLGGLMVSYLALDKIAGGEGVFRGFSILVQEMPEKFTMILDPSSPHYASLPGISVLVGGLWIMNLSYWGFNQYITQRALAAKSLTEAQKGIAFAAYLKLLMPVIVVLPGIAAAMLAPDLERPDQAYPEMMKMVPQGLLGITL